MTAITIPNRETDTETRPRRTSALATAVLDTLAVTRRNLISLRRTPTIVMFSTIQPIIFVLMFRYVFGGSIRIPGQSYVNYLMPGIFVQTVAFGSTNTGVGLATDLQTGLIERFRSLPMARSAVLAGRVVADMVRNVFVIALMLIVGYIVGFRVQTGPVQLLAACGLILLFGLALSSVTALLGLITRNAEAAQAAAFPFLAVMVFASSAFVLPKTMPGVLRAFASHQPVTASVNAVRALVLGGAIAEHVVVALAWSIAVIAVFSSLAVAQYRRAA